MLLHFSTEQMDYDRNIKGNSASVVCNMWFSAHPRPQSAVPGGVGVFFDGE